MKEQLRDFLEYLRLNRNASAHTIAAYDSDLEQYLGFVAAEAGQKVADLDPESLDLTTIRLYMGELPKQGQSR
jgi:integrase/recombinase XerC